ncbi:MAG TPA: rod shape-determining protein MreC [Selenomonas sp.]|jgi:rod shape-determining protein MreC|nr:rod shape-determining protein MreC [Selenomonadaceae bacterium]MDD6119641.1 rod shape-determining protein MreC [Selenomonadaceae bacterium]MDD7056001.1 rod shape-determining protein MreC [Selenomonadaceae bacterium]MDY3915699.1 rod shape-determining protein MreC [Selenomonadaceae bacterium]HBT78680.1 rod shape-determining protein MreC [Selenomonas sp.]
MGKYSREKNPRRKWWLLLVVLVSVFCIVFFAANGRFRVPVSSRAVSLVLSPFQSAVGWVGTQVTYLESEVWDFLTLHEQNKMLRNEVTQLRVQNLQAQEYASENTRLREMLDYKNTATQFDLKAARVIGRESATWSSMIVINRGTVDGVHEDMPVVTPKGLVGRVVEAGPNSSKVQLIIDPRSSVGTLVQRPESRVNGIVEGDPDNPTMPRMVNIPKTADVQEGDVIVTSGFGGVFPKGLVVGIVSQLKIDTGGLLQVAILEPAVDFQKLEDVMVITASREAPPEPFQTPEQTPGTETDPAQEAKEAAQQAAAQQEAAQSGGQQVEAGQP